jgi:hypothetical protein
MGPSAHHGSVFLPLAQRARYSARKRPAHPRLAGVRQTAGALQPKAILGQPRFQCAEHARQLFDHAPGSVEEETIAWWLLAASVQATYGPTRNDIGDTFSAAAFFEPRDGSERNAGQQSRIPPGAHQLAIDFTHPLK